MIASWRRLGFRRAGLLFGLILPILATHAWALAGALDPSFSNDGRATIDFGAGQADGAFKLAIQTDGKILSIGYSDQGTTGYDFGLVRLNWDGSLDYSFSGDGLQTIDFGSHSDDWGHGIALQPDGKILVVGAADTDGGAALSRLLPNGELDPSFSGDGRRTIRFARRSVGNARAVAIQQDGRIVVAGESFDRAGNLKPTLARFRRDGSLDKSFSGDGRLTMTGHQSGIDKLTSASAGGVVIQHDGAITTAVEGLFDRRQPTLDVAQFTPKGKPDHRFSGDGRRTLGRVLSGYSGDPALAAGRHGRILVAGYLDRRRSVIFRLTRKGARDDHFSRDGRQTIALGVANDVALQGRRKIVLVGKHRDGFGVARLRQNGALDHSFSGDGRKRIRFGSRRSEAFGVATHAGAIVVAGNAHGNSTRLDVALARLAAH
jgi:uncharacterized delta-60 repeat protein